MNSSYNESAAFEIRRISNDRKLLTQLPFLHDDRYALSQLRLSSTWLPLDGNRGDTAQQTTEGVKRSCGSPRVDVRVLRFPKILSSSNQGTLARVFSGLRLIVSGREPSPIVLDLTSMRMCGAGFVNGLTASRDELTTCVAEVVIAGDPDGVLTLFQVHRLIPIYPNLNAALLNVMKKS